jgi:hypothetical protein
LRIRIRNGTAKAAASYTVLWCQMFPLRWLPLVEPQTSRLADDMHTFLTIRWIRPSSIHWTCTSAAQLDGPVRKS